MKAANSVHGSQPLFLPRCGAVDLLLGEFCFEVVLAVPVLPRCLKAAAGKSSKTLSALSLTWDDASPDDRAPWGAREEAGTGTEAGKEAGAEAGMGRGVSSEGRDEEEGSGKREVTGEPVAGRIELVKEVGISES